MKIERTKNAARSIAVGLILRLYQTVVPFLMRTAMIHFMGVEYLGLNSLFSSILHILNLAELGVGSVMVYGMYKPIAEDDTPRICALMGLYRKYYRLIGLVIGAAGLILMPFVPSLISGEVPSELNIYWLYLLNLGATVLTYWLFAYRNCLLQAHQRLDISSVITIAASTVQYVLQLLILVYVKDYYLYVIVLLLGTIVNNILTALVTLKKFPQYKPVGRLERAEVRSINGKIRDLFSGKLGSVILQHVDTVVISAFLGLTVLAVYQNYYFIMSSVIMVIELLVSSITAGLGNSFVTESKEKNARDLMKFSFLFLWLTGVCSCCFLGMYQPFMELWVGAELMLDFGVVACMAAYFYVYTLNRLLSTYKDAGGLWHQDRFRPLASAGANLVMNLLMVNSLGVYGIVLSTVLSMALIGLPWLMRILFTRLFDRSLMIRFLRQLAAFSAVTILSGSAVCLICMHIMVQPWVKLLLCLLVCITVPNILFLLLMHRSEQFRPSLQFADRLTKKKLHLERLIFRK